MIQTKSRLSLRLAMLAAYVSLALISSACGGDDSGGTRVSSDAMTGAAGAQGQSAAPETKTIKKPDIAADSSRDSCGNGLDDDGNKLVDDDCPCEAGSEQRCFVGSGMQAGVGACKWGVQKCSGDASGEFRTWGPCLEQKLPTNEECGDSVDNDCDGEVDEDCGCKEGSTEPCKSDCGAGERVCRAGEYGECSARKPSAELCNGIDDDCNGEVDDDIMQECSSACGAGTQRCEDGEWSACSAKSQEPETCNGVDDDCDGVVDNIERACSGTCGAGRQRCVSGTWSECSAREPEAESCNGVDDDCDGVVDDIEMDCSTACGEGTRTCTRGQWSSCSAAAPSSETCNDVDDDCDGDVDENLTALWGFHNVCTESRVFVAVGGCNVCQETCQGYWVDPDEILPQPVEEDACFTMSAFARTADGDICLNASGGDWVGETRDFCHEGCAPTLVNMRVRSGC